MTEKHVSKVATSDGDAAPLFAGDGLSTRLEFSISLSMLNRPSADIDKTVHSPPPRIQSQAKRKSLRHLIHAHVRRPDAAPQAPAKKSKGESLPLPVDTFNLPLPKIPSPLASFGGELQWPDSANKAVITEKTPEVVLGDKAEAPTPGNVIESDDDEA
ncbi:hypothetical protein LPJ60_006547, partial [Coemansia sp. RSA 2675]